MAFTKKIWVDVPDPSNPPAIPEGQDALARFDAANMNRIEEGVERALTSGAIGRDATVTSGGAIGNSASANEGGSAGDRAVTTSGGAVGSWASSTNGGAVGNNAKAGSGFAGGSQAKTLSANGDVIDAVQLGQGINNTPRTLQAYDYQIMKADGTIPLERMPVLPISKGGTGATKDFEAADSLMVKSIGGGTEVAENADLNSYVTVGNYICSQSSVAQGLTNCPIPKAFVMTVGYAHGGSAYISQEITQFDTGVKYYRYYNTFSKVWNDWQGTYGTANDPVVKGRYSGDGEESQFIDLGFTPSIVEVYAANGLQNMTVGDQGIGHYFGGLAISDYPCQANMFATLVPIVSITPNGFEVFYKTGGINDPVVCSNRSGFTYYYIARR